MAVFTDSGIQFDYTFDSIITGQQPQPNMAGRCTVVLNTALSTFRASVRATALSNNPAEINHGRWRAGFIQEIQSSCRIGHYHKDVRTEHRLWGVPATFGAPGSSIRDSSGGEEPYDGHSADLVHGQPVGMQSEDDPALELPLELVIDDVSRTLTGVTGGDRFTIWLAATRDAAPKRLVILGRIEWRVNWRAVVSGNRNTAMIPLTQLVAHEPAELGIAAAFGHGPLPAGFPQDLTDIEGQDLFYRITFFRGIEINRNEIDIDPAEPSAAMAQFPVMRAEASPWW